MKLRQIVASLERQHGGPSISVRALSGALAEHGHDVELFATEPTLDAPRREAVANRLNVALFPRGWPGRFCPSTALREASRLGPVDVVHHHGLWLRPLHYAMQTKRATGAPLVISPRGMMEPWAWRHHRVRKALARWLIHPGALAATDAWHATSDQEANGIRALGFSQPICVAPNGVNVPAEAELVAAREHWHARCPALRERRVALFYSRLHDKKRVRELIALWAARPADDWLLLVVGIPEGITVAELQNAAAAAGAAESVKVFDGTSEPAPYAAAEIMLLPTHSENFGLVIAEAMASAVPVVVTDTTPWSEISAAGFGWWIPWSQFPAAVAAATSLPPETLKQQGAAARTWIARRFSWRLAAQALGDFYLTLVRPA